MPDVVAEVFDGNEFAVFCAAGFEGVFAVEGEAAVLGAGVAEVDGDLFGGDEDVVDLGGADGEVEVRADQGGLICDERGEAEQA